MDHEPFGRFPRRPRKLPPRPEHHHLSSSPTTASPRHPRQLHKMYPNGTAPAHIPLGIHHPRHARRAGNRPPRLAPQHPQDDHGAGGPPPPPPTGTSGQSLTAPHRPRLRPLRPPVVARHLRLRHPLRPPLDRGASRTTAYFRYPNGEEHVYDLAADPGETTNHRPATAPPGRPTAPNSSRGALNLGLDLRGLENPRQWRQRHDGPSTAPSSSPEGAATTNYWPTAQTPRRIREDKERRAPTRCGTWPGPDDYIPTAHRMSKRFSASAHRASPGRMGRLPPRAPGAEGKPIRHRRPPPTARSSSKPPNASMIDLRGLRRRRHHDSAPSIGAATFLTAAAATDLNDRQGEAGQPPPRLLTARPGTDTAARAGRAATRSTAAPAMRHPRLTPGATIIHGGHANDWIEDGRRAPSTIDPGPGRNTVHAGRRGAHEVHCTAPASTRITAAPGAKRWSWSAGAASA